MAYEGTKLTWTFIAGADLSAAANQYKFVKLNSNAKEVVLASGTTDNVVGVLQDTPALGEACEVVIFGVTKVAAGASYNPGVILSTTAGGLAQTAVSTQQKLGHALESGANGVITTMLFNPYGVVA